MFRSAVTFSFAGAFALITSVYGQHLVDLPRTLADSGTLVEPVKTGITYCEGPVVDRKGNLFFSEQNAGVVWKVTPDGSATKWRTGINTPNGMEFDIDGYLVCCENGMITKVDTAGRVIKTMTSAASYGKINDLSIASDGGMFFTNNSNAFWYRSPDSVITAYNYFSGQSPNGIEYIEEKSILYVNMSTQARVCAFQVAANRTVDTGSRRNFVTNVNTPDGITVDSNYNVYVAANSAGKINVYDSSGVLLGSITMKQDNNPSMNASNCVFGGPDDKTLYITGDSGVFKIRLKIPGRAKPGFAGVKERERLVYHGNSTSRGGVSLPLFLPRLRPYSFNECNSRGNNSAVRITLYDVRGAKVLGNVSTMEYAAFRNNCSGLSSGVYVVRVGTTP